MNDPLLERLKGYGRDLDVATELAATGASTVSPPNGPPQRRVLPVLVAAVCVGIVIAVLATNRTAGPRTAAETTLPTTALTETATGQVTAHFEFSATEVVAGGTLEGWLVIDNNTGHDIDVTHDGCAPKWGVRLTNATIQQRAGFTMECNFNPAGTLILPGTTRLPTSLSAIYSECTRDPIPSDASILACLPSPADPIPPLPPGEYQAVFVGDLPGVPTPAPVKITVMEASTTQST